MGDSPFHTRLPPPSPICSSGVAAAVEPGCRGVGGPWQGGSWFLSPGQGGSDGCAPKHDQTPCLALFSLSPCSSSQLSLLLPVLPAMREGEALQSKVGLIYCSLARRWILKERVCS